MFLNIVLLAVSLVIIAVSADRFVLGAARSAELAKVSPLFIGVVIVGFGTGLPELMTAVLASIHGNPALGISSVIGSTVINSTLVLGTLGAISAPVISSSVLKREGLSQVAAVLAFSLVIVLWQNRIGYIVLLGGLAVFGLSMARQNKAKDGVNLELEREVAQIEHSHNWSLKRSLTVTLTGLVAVLVSAELLVTSATNLARSLGLAPALIGVTIVALGTSLPEWVTAFAAARRGQSDLVIGNVFGANFFNATGVAGIAGTISPDILHIRHLQLELGFMIATSLLAWYFLSSQRRLSKKEGWSLIVVFALWIAMVSL